ncbi:MAG: hypothetical protein SGARI_004639, partial [Bacillariaceae sp.]
MTSDIVVGPGYLDALDTIPEDGSVAAVNIQHAVPQSVTNLSTVSAVASSDSDPEGDGIEVVDTRTSQRQKARSSTRRGKRPRQGAAVRTSSGTGAAVAGDAFSDTHASLGGAAELPDRQAPSEAAPTEDLYSAKSCTKRRMSFYLIVAALLVITPIVIYFIVINVSSNSNGASASAESAESQPTQDPVFPPYFFESESVFPSISPTFNQDDVDEFDDALSRIVGVDTSLLYDTTTPEGECRHWMTHGDQQELRGSEVGESRVQQRYVLCLLYHYTNGDSWTINGWLEGGLHECDWQGVTCNATTVAGIELEAKNLTGTLPEALLSLSKLQFLSFLDNSIAGTIPTAIFDRLRKLMWLDFSNNQFSGEIPTGSENVPVNLKI